MERRPENELSNASVIETLSGCIEILEAITKHEDLDKKSINDSIYYVVRGLQSCVHELR